MKGKFLVKGISIVFVQQPFISPDTRKSTHLPSTDRDWFASMMKKMEQEENVVGYRMRLHFVLVVTVGGLSTRKRD